MDSEWSWILAQGGTYRPDVRWGTLSQDDEQDCYETKLQHHKTHVAWLRSQGWRVTLYPVIFTHSAAYTTDMQTLFMNLNIQGPTCHRLTTKLQRHTCNYTWKTYYTFEKSSNANTIDVGKGDLIHHSSDMGLVSVGRGPAQAPPLNSRFGGPALTLRGLFVFVFVL